MDFHSLTRRELQTLCKKKKIPANMTNVAMADALQALESDEGLEELLTQSETEPLKTPGKSITASSVTRTSNRRRIVKEKEPESSILTTRTCRGTKNAEGETEKGNEDMPAASSACTKVPVAPHRNIETSHLKEGKKSTAVRVYSTRRSTRLLEKKMSDLSLKENGDMVDVKANLEKDSQVLQRQFSEDLENSQVLEVIPENKIFSYESNVTAEAVEESSVVEVPEQNMDVLLEKGKLSEDGMTENKTIGSSAVDEVEEYIKENECNNGEDQQAVKEDAEQLDEASHTEVLSDEIETQRNFNVSDGTQVGISEPIYENEEVVFLRSELTTTENDGLGIAAEDDISLSEITSVLAEIQQGIDDTQEAIPELATMYVEEISVSEAVDYAKKVDSVVAEFEDSVSHLSATKLELSSEMTAESDNHSDNNQNVDQLVESIYIHNENLCPVNILLDSEVAPESLLAGDVRVEPASPGYVNQNSGMAKTDSKGISRSNQSSPFQASPPLMPKNQFHVTPCKSSSKKSASGRMVHISDNKENKIDRKTVSLQDENASAAIGTPIDKKSLRQLRKMVKGFYQQAEER